MAEAGENDDHEEECDSGEAGAEEEEAGKTRRRLGQRQEGVILERGVVVESGAVVEASVVGAGTVIEVRARIGRGCVIGKHCKIAPTLSIPPYTSLPDHTVVYGPLPTQRRTDRSGTSELRARMNGRHVEVLRVLMADKLVRAV
ncbi:MAG: hypothetical protein M1819_005617 [Sarea resinae]|nr:MAG: hypothetical protein M1819_005617 [Sarea resinae]